MIPNSSRKALSWSPIAVYAIANCVRVGAAQSIEHSDRFFPFAHQGVNARGARCSVGNARAAFDARPLLEKHQRFVILAHRLVHIGQSTIGARGALRIQFDCSVEMNNRVVVPARAIQNPAKE